MNDEMQRNLRRFHDLISKNTGRTSVVRLLEKIYTTFLDQKSSALRLRVDESLQPCTDGKTITVSLIPDLLKDRYTTEDWLIILKAALAHESQHVNSSNFKDISKIRGWYGKILAREAGVGEEVGARIGKDMLNIVEDGRIEAIAVQRRPGMFLPFMYLNQIIREGTEIKEAADSESQEFADFINNVLSYAKTGLYSPGIEVYSGTRLEETFLKIENLIDEGVKARSSYECRLAVMKILETATPYIKELVQDEELQNQMQQPSADEYSSNSENQYNDGSGKSLRADSATNENSDGQGQSECGEKDNFKEQKKDGGHTGGSSEDQGDETEENTDGKQNQSENSKKDQKSDSDKMKGQSDNRSQDESDQNQSSSNKQNEGFSNAKQPEPVSDERLDEIRREMGKQLKASPNPKPVPSSTLDESGLRKVLAAYKGAGDGLNETEAHIPICCELPNELKAQAQALRKEIKKVIDAKKNASKNLRRGQLNTADLWKTGLRDETIFERRTKIDRSSITFYILIDNSGSMGDAVSVSLRKFEAARSAAAVVEEAVKSLLPCKIALFNEVYKTNHIVIKDFDDRQKGNFSWNSLKTIMPNGSNADSVNIRIAAEELSRRREVRKVLFVLSDGLPSAYDSAEDAGREVRQAVKDARSKGIFVIPIMFGTKSFLENNFDEYQKMYEKNIISCSPQQITATLVKTFRLVLTR